MKIVSKYRNICGSLFLAAGLCASAVMVQAEPWISAPSSDAPDGRVEVNGGGMDAGDLALVLIWNNENGQFVGYRFVQVGPDGGYGLELPGGETGQLRVDVWSMNSRSKVAYTHLVAGTGQ